MLILLVGAFLLCLRRQKKGGDRGYPGYPGYGQQQYYASNSGAYMPMGTESWSGVPLMKDMGGQPVYSYATQNPFVSQSNSSNPGV